MPEAPPVERTCPYLRGRKGRISSTPGDNNYCLLASSIHLPRAQQTRYCLGGHFEDCTRYQRQAARPVPRYVRGARPVQVRPNTPTVRLHTLPWRYPWVRPVLKWLLIILLVVGFVALWRWRMAETKPYVVQRDPVPTPLVTPVLEQPEQYLLPTAGPPEW
jgi:hypothetical protein